MTTFGTPGSIAEHNVKLPTVSANVNEAPLNAYPLPPPQDSRPISKFASPAVPSAGPDKESLSAKSGEPTWTPLGDQGYFRRSHAVYSSHLPVLSKLNLLDSTELADSDLPLSMRFMHKPLRSNDQFRIASDPTRRNSIINAHIDDSPVDASPTLDSHGSPAHSRCSSMDESQYRLVRKKSGEIVKSLLKDSYSCHRSKSLPSTPSFKLVHFGNDNDIRYFSKKDRPTAILAQNSPSLEGQLDIMDDDDDMSGSDRDQLHAQTEFDYFDEELNSHPDSRSYRREDASITRYPTPHHGRLIDWDVKVMNFPTLPIQDRITSIRPPVLLERVFVSVDKKFLLGHIAVSNITYEKYVTVRYTLDNWATIVEIPTIYVPDIPSVLKRLNYDRFVFKIPLDSMFNSFHLGNEEEFLFSKEHLKLYHLCIRYCLPGHEFWDNNGGKDYLIKIKKTIRSGEQLAGPASTTENHTKQHKQTPHLLGGAPPPPKNARSKPDTHSQRPKYSSHYMKRFHSESDLKSPSKFGNPKKETKPTDPNDFEKNNLFLSSPLFSSIKNNNVEDLYNDTLKGAVQNNSDKHSMNFSDALPQPTSLSTSHNFNTHGDPKYEERDISALDLKSYRELLESYCFFTAPSQDVCSNDSSPIEPCMEADRKVPEFGRTPDPDVAFTVSSFLRN